MTAARCYNCLAPITFASMADGTVQPVNPAPDTKGTIVALRKRDGHLIDGRPAGTRTPAGRVRLMPHQHPERTEP